MLLETLFIILLLSLSGFFSSSEIALSGISSSRTKALVKNGKLPQEALWLKENIEDVLVAILIGNNVVNILASSYVTVLFYSLFSEEAIAIATGLMTFLILTFGEIVPKTLAYRFSEEHLMFSSKFLFYLTKALSPLIWIFRIILKTVNKLFRRKKEHYEGVVEAEIREILKEGLRKGVIKSLEQESIRKILEFDKIPVKEFMLSYDKVLAFPEKTTVREALNKIISSNLEVLEKIPIYKRDKSDVTGVVDVVNIIKASKNNPHAPLSQISEPPIFIEENESMYHALEKLSRTNSKVIFVEGKGSKISGVLTLLHVSRVLLK